MKEFYLKFIIPLIILIMSAITLSYGVRLYKENHLDVPGTVIGKYESVARRPYKPFLKYTKWWLSVKPYDSKYKDFNVASDQVDPNGHSDFFSVLILVSGLVGCVTSSIKLINDTVSIIV